MYNCIRGGMCAQNASDNLDVQGKVELKIQMSGNKKEKEKIRLCNVSISLTAALFQTIINCNCNFYDKEEPVIFIEEC